MNTRTPDITRRQLFRAGGTAVISSSFASLPMVRASAEQDGDQALIDQAFKAQARSDFAEAESLFRRLVDLGRSDEFILRGLAWNLSRQWKHVEAIRISLDNNRKNPCAWSVAQVCDAYVSSGDYDTGRKWLKFAKENESKWGDAKPAFEAAIEEVAVKTYVLEHAIEPLNPGQNGSFVCPLPLSNLPYQTSQYEVIGAKSYREDTRGGNPCIWVAADAGKKPIVRCTVTVRPMSFASKVQKFTEEDIPTEIKHYLKSTRNVEVDSATVQSLVAQLKGDTSIATIQNICKWGHFNLKYDGTSNVMEAGGGTVAVLNRKTGHCEGMTSGPVGLLRAAGVPARFVRGHGGIAGKSGIPSMHSWTEFYVPSVGWIQWDFNNAPFAVPAKVCIGKFRYTSPYAAPGGGDAETAILWDFNGGGTGNVGFTRTKLEL